MQERKPVDWDELYPGRFLKAGEFAATRSNRVLLTITAVDLDELESDDGKKVKGVITFREVPRQLAMNKTNGICLKAMFGRKVQEWVGKRIVLFADKWNGEDCIRVYGSPELREDIKVEIKLPRRKPYNMVMHAPNNPGNHEPPPPDSNGEMTEDEERHAFGGQGGGA